MALPDLHWKTVEYSSRGLNTVELLLDAIYDMYTTVTEYVDGETRTPGSGSAWTVTRYQDTGVTEALYFTPPSSDVSDLRVIIAGQTSVTKTPTMDIDIFTANDLVYGFNKGSGSFNAWDNASPFTTGNFSGYNGAGIAVANMVPFRIIVNESEEAMCISFVDEAEGRWATGFMAGAFINPISTDASDAETNGRLYGGANGATIGSTRTIWIDSANPSFFSHRTLNRYEHCFTFTPGAGTLTRMRNYVSYSVSEDIHHTRGSRRLRGYPVHFFDTSTLESIGWGRNMAYSTNLPSSNPLYDVNGNYIGCTLTFQDHETNDKGLVLWDR